MENSKKQNIIRVVVLVFVIALTVVLLIYRDHVQEFEALGYPGLLIMSVLANATVFIPVPGVIMTSAMSVVFDPFWVAVVTGIGAGLGELSGYLAGFSGQGLAERTKWYVRFENWMKNYGGWTVFLLAIIPNPLFDLAGIIAGVLKMPLIRFLFFCIAGKIIKMLFFAYFGVWIMSLLGIN